MDTISRKSWLQAVAAFLAVAAVNPVALLPVEAVETEAVRILSFDSRPCLIEGDTLSITWAVNF